MPKRCSVELRSEDGLAYVTLTRRGAASPRADLLLIVRAAAHGFAGLHDQVWVDGAAAERFRQELAALERVRDGTAELRSMSPDEFVLAVTVLDHAGHVAVSIALRRSTYVGDRSVHQALALTFEADPTQLPRAVADFEALCGPPAATGGASRPQESR